jgi:hypothetical protein
VEHALHYFGGVEIVMNGVHVCTVLVLDSFQLGNTMAMMLNKQHDYQVIHCLVMLFVSIGLYLALGSPSQFIIRV